MSFQEFLEYVRLNIGHYCTDSYWEGTYESLKDKSQDEIMALTSLLAINAIATHSNYLNG